MRLIDADALKDDLRESYNALKKIYERLEYNDDRAICGGQISTFLEAISRVRAAPTIDAEPVKHGRWLWDGKHYCCSVCSGTRFHDLVLGLDAAYCPYCGAKMEVDNG